MKKIILSLLILCFMTIIGFSQDIEGSWNGVLDVQSIKLRLVFKIAKTETGYSATMESPDQGAKGIPVASVAFENSELNLDIKVAGAKYNGKLNSDETFEGTFTQGGASFPLNLNRGTPAVLVRPQEPKEPYPYYSEDVKFINAGAKIALAGTLTLPKKDGVYPVVVLISGSGPQNRNEELLGHKPFLVLADHLTRNGIGVLRFDDRGVGESEGSFGKATSADFASDVEAAVRYLKGRKDINKSKIGLIGHSEGGIIAPMVAAGSKDVAFIVLLAGTGIPGDQLLLMQKELIERASGVKETDIQAGQEMLKGAYEIIKSASGSSDVKKELADYFKDKQVAEKDAAPIVSQLASDWMQYFIRFDPSTVLKKVNVPVLAVNGEKDLQVPAERNLSAIKLALDEAGTKDVTIKAFPKLNHL